MHLSNPHFVLTAEEVHPQKNTLTRIQPMQFTCHTSVNSCGRKDRSFGH
jgi:hypothetical protein